MAGKFETVENFARELESEKIMQVKFVPDVYRNQPVNRVDRVYIENSMALVEKLKMLKDSLPEIDREIELGAFGAKMKKTYAEWKIELIEDIMKGRIREVYEPLVAEPAEPVGTIEPVVQVEPGTVLVPVEEPVQVVGGPVQNALGVLEQAVAQVIVQTQGKAIADQVIRTAIEEVKAFIAKEYGPVTKKVSLETPNGTVKTIDGVLHEKFDEILAFVQAGEPVYLCGPAGAGKNVVCKQIAEALGLDFYFTNAVTQEYKLTGFTDAMGVFQESQFYKAFKNGGLFFLDEMDGSIPEVLIILNAAIANGYFDFPAPIGYVEAHPDFRVIAAGNTYGTGASMEYVGRAQLDAASLDRFAFINVDYDINIEMNCAGNDEALVSFIRDLRASADEAGLKIVLSYRTIRRIAKMQEALGIRRALETCLFKGMEANDIDLLLRGLSNKANKYARAMID